MNPNNSKSFKYKAKLVGETVAHFAPSNNDEILKNAIVFVPLKCRSKFWISFEMLLTICKGELKLTWKYWVLAATGAANADGSSKNAIFTIKDTRL